MMTFICELCLMNHVQVFYRLITEHFLSRGIKRCEIRGPVKSPTFKHLALESYALWASTSKLPGEWKTTSDRGARVAQQNNSSAQHIRQTKSTSSFSRRAVLSELLFRFQRALSEFHHLVTEKDSHQRAAEASCLTSACQAPF